jgi:hypothetical protein
MISNQLLLLAAAFLDEYADRLGNDGCNDWNWPAGLSEEEKAALRGEEYDGKWPPPNWLAVRRLAGMLRAMGNRP